jgi:trans-4-hydroxy-L-proline dehydratase
VVDTQTLRQAQQTPDEYKNLLVRVAGYSDYFVDLDADHQEEIISRTQQETA